MLEESSNHTSGAGGGSGRPASAEANHPAPHGAGTAPQGSMLSSLESVLEMLGSQASSASERPGRWPLRRATLGRRVLHSRVRTVLIELRRAMSARAPDVPTARAFEALLERLTANAQRGGLSRDDLRELSLFAVEILPADAVMLRSRSFAEQCAQMAATETDAALYRALGARLAEHPETVRPTELGELWAQRVNLGTQIQAAERLRKQQTRATALVAIVCILALLPLVAWTWAWPVQEGTGFGLLAMMLVAGTAGGLLSVVWRIRGTPMRDYVVLVDRDAGPDLMITLAPAFGMAGALVVMVLVSAGIFPIGTEVIRLGSCPGSGWFQAARTLLAVCDLDRKGIALMVLIGFASGWSERLVPDSLGALWNQTRADPPPGVR